MSPDPTRVRICPSCKESNSGIGEGYSVELCGEEDINTNDDDADADIIISAAAHHLLSQDALCNDGSIENMLTPIPEKDHALVLLKMLKLSGRGQTKRG